MQQIPRLARRLTSSSASSFKRTLKNQPQIGGKSFVRFTSYFSQCGSRMAKLFCGVRCWLFRPRSGAQLSAEVFLGGMVDVAGKAKLDINGVSREPLRRSREVLDWCTTSSQSKTSRELSELELPQRRENKYNKTTKRTLRRLSSVSEFLVHCLE